MPALPQNSSSADRLQRSLGVMTEAEMARLAQDFAFALRPGDCIALSGDLGSGKSTFARALIRAVIGDADGRTDIPSPTFTLVQTYRGRLPVAHFDLYRIADAAEIDELGLGEALLDGVALVEWPERAGDRLPPDHVRITLSEASTASGADARALALTAPDGFVARLDRSLAIRRLLSEAGHGDAWRAPLAGDASTRRYETATDADWRRIVMDAPPMPDGPPVRDGKPYSRIAHLAEDIGPFIAIARALKANGFAAPAIDAIDYQAGLVLLEDLGRDPIIDAARVPIAERYAAAMACLADLHDQTWPREIEIGYGPPHIVPPFDRDAFLIEVDLLLDWFVPRATGTPAGASDRADYHAIWSGLFDIVDAGEKTLVMRDFHSPNIIWRGERSGNDRIGLIDFQDALWGHPAYDVMSLALDVRVDMPEALTAALVDQYCAARHEHDRRFDETAFRTAAAILAAQRASKVLGIFVRLDERDGKPAYLPHLPRIQGYLRRCFADPVLADLKAWFETRGLLSARIGPR